jgi:predicted dehydrogenase
MSEPLRICGIGAGNLSSRRIWPLIGQAGGSLAGICDLDPVKAGRIASLYGGTVYGEAEAMVDAERPDAVLVCINSVEHARLAKLFMAKGYPVYTEKPAAPTAADALEVARVSKATGRLCSTGFKKRYNNAYTRAKQFIDGIKPEDLYAISIDYASAQYGNTGQRDSFLHDFCIHIIDLVPFLFGDVRQVFAFSKGPDAYAVSLRFANGAVGSLCLNDGRSFAVPTEEVEISARGGNFMTVHNSSTWRITENGKPTEWREPPTFTSAGDSGNETGHLAELADFVAAVREGRSTRSAIYESYKSMVLYDAIKASAEAGGAVIDVHYETL